MIVIDIEEYFIYILIIVFKYFFREFFEFLLIFEFYDDFLRIVGIVYFN